MDKAKLDNILELHKKWLNGEKDGERADLSDADLSDANLRGADLSYAQLSGADLSGANLLGANLSGTDLFGANLNGADLRYARLSGADLSYAHLFCADLSDASLNDADLSGADLNYAHLFGAYLRGTKTDNCKYNEATAFFSVQCPDEGDFVGWKKCHNHIVKLLVTGKRSSATTRKCRCSEAKVLWISDGLESVAGDRDDNFIYKVGETVSVPDFDDDRWNECSTGIHFFITRTEAENYN